MVLLASSSLADLGLDLLALTTPLVSCVCMRACIVLFRKKQIVYGWEMHKIPDYL